MIRFSGIDVVARELRDSDRVRSVVAAVLSVPEPRVVVIRDISDYPPRDAADVVVIVTPSEVDSSAVLSIQTEPRELTYTAEDDLLARLCQELGVNLLAPQAGTNPYVMREYEPGRTSREVSLDPEAYEEGRYIVIGR